MTDTSQIFQCEVCLRYFGAGEGGQPDPTPVKIHGLGIPDAMIVCGLEDCGQVAAERAQQDADIRARRRRFSPRSKVQGPKSLSAPADFRSSCPRDTEPLDPRPSTLHPSLPHKDQVRAFAVSINAADQNKLMLELLCESFDESRPEVAGAWVPNSIFQAAGIGRPNCRASDLRGTELVDAHAFIKFHGLDVDCSRIENPTGNEKEYYAYRLCLKEQSTRLAREHKRKVDQRQGELA